MMKAYSLLDFGNEQRLEQWGDFRLIRPDPTAIGVPEHPEFWKSADATYVGEKGKGQWHLLSKVPEKWPVEFGDISLTVHLTPYKHTGVFPEQLENWEWMRKHAKNPLTILNLFAYTGGATVALANDGHFVTHVDSSRPAITWAKENAMLNNIPEDKIRWMLEDALVFAARELKRGKKYDGIILDPPAYGHGPTGKAWRTERDLKPLLEICAALLSGEPAFFLLNGYAEHDTSESFHRLLNGILHSKTHLKNFQIEAKELLLKTEDGRTLSTGIVARCAFSHQRAHEGAL